MFLVWFLLFVSILFMFLCFFLGVRIKWGYDSTNCVSNDGSINPFGLPVIFCFYTKLYISLVCIILFLSLCNIN
jgi:hypothetical protein